VSTDVMQMFIHHTRLKRSVIRWVSAVNSISHSQHLMLPGHCRSHQLCICHTPTSFHRLLSTSPQISAIYCLLQWRQKSLMW